MKNENKRNCNTCKFSMFFKTCETLKNNKEYQEIGGSDDFNIKKWEFRKNFVCDNYKSCYIEYPVEVSKINNNASVKRYENEDIGKFVRILPCGNEYKGKTYLGLYLGDLPIGNSITYNEKTKELNVNFVTNPAIFVFELKKLFLDVKVGGK